MRIFRRRAVVCEQFVELVTDYLEGALPPTVAKRIDRHLGGCDACHEVLEQWRTVVALTGRVTPDDVGELAPAVRDDLLAAFRAART